MTLVRFNTNGARKELQRVPFFNPMITDIFDSFLNRDALFTEAVSFVPSVNVSETANEYRIEAALPGMKKEDVKIEVDNKVLTIVGERKNEQAEEKPDYSRCEFTYGSFKRSFTLPDSVESDNIVAEYINGILSIKLPKRDEAKPKPSKEIKIV